QARGRRARPGPPGGVARAAPRGGWAPFAGVLGDGGAHRGGGRRRAGRGHAAPHGGRLVVGSGWLRTPGSRGTGEGRGPAGADEGQAADWAGVEGAGPVRRGRPTWQERGGERARFKLPATRSAS